MSNNDDFTFCQVGPPVNPDTWEPLKTFPNIGGITIKEGSSNEASINQMDGFMVKDSSLTSASSNKQKTVGSLSSNVTDVSAKSELSKHAGDSGKFSQGQKSVVKKPAARAKVPFEKGYSPMDWFRLNRAHPDLAGLKGQSNKRLISMEEVEQHQKEGSIWTVLKGRVYNISPYMKFHPGGVDKLMSAAGKDCTSMFNKYHAWVNAEFLLEKCLVGTLDDSR